MAATLVTEEERTVEHAVMNGLVACGRYLAQFQPFVPSSTARTDLFVYPQLLLPSVSPRYFIPCNRLLPLVVERTVQVISPSKSLRIGVHSPTVMFGVQLRFGMSRPSKDVDNALNLTGPDLIEKTKKVIAQYKGVKLLWLINTQFDAGVAAAPHRMNKQTVTESII
ncbi:hypothetical protein BT69DRAFT_1358391 [Atractiella rhizophila]|nr:hypothetical protein BT69DRAFT_1358391 [Atractiella rhizophila]